MLAQTSGGGNILFELSALGTALLWSFSALCWTLAGRRIGAIGVTVIRLIFATVMMLAIRWALCGSPLPQAPTQAYLLLVGSGVIAMAGGDYLLFRSFLSIGPRLGMLILALSPILSAMIALAFMDERIDAYGTAGIVLTVGGVIAVVTQPRHASAQHAHGRAFYIGLALCVGSAVLSSVGFAMSRQALSYIPKVPGLAESMRISFDAATIRVASGAIASFAVLPLLGELRPMLAGLRDRWAMLIVVIGTIVGPVVGVWLSMVAFWGLKTGVATALINVSPLFMIPISFFAFRDRPGIRGVIGTIIALAGIFLLLWR